MEHQMGTLTFNQPTIRPFVSSGRNHPTFVLPWLQFQRFLQGQQTTEFMMHD